MGILLAVSLACDTDTGENHSATVHIEKTEEGYQLIRNGQPFYIKGGAAKPDYLEELKSSGANTARIYDTLYLQRTLDKAHSLDLAVVVDLPLPKFNDAAKYYENEALFKIIKTKISKTVNKFHDHPALLYWNLGNELYYPYLYNSTKFYSSFNELIDIIHQTDPNHPVSTTTIGANKSRVLSIITRSPQLDFISFNSFGVLSKFSKKLKPISPVWDGPHVITEWGVNGPWEASFTNWQAPIEETSTKKAEQIRKRYLQYIKPLKEEGSLGSFVFYWGRKNEITPTWYSLFGENQRKTQAVFELKKIWKETDELYSGPEMDYMLLNGKGAAQSIVLRPEAQAVAEVILPKHKEQKITYKWEVKQEYWHKSLINNTSSEVKFEINGNKVNFITTEKSGPYRLFVYLTNDTEYYATANIPFYVLNPEDEE